MQYQFHSDKKIKSTIPQAVTHGQWDVRSIANFPAIKDQFPVTSTNLYCLVAETCMNNFA